MRVRITITVEDGKEVSHFDTVRTPTREQAEDIRRASRCAQMTPADTIAAITCGMLEGEG